MSGTRQVHQTAVWHPNVHHYFGERLYYFVIQFSEYISAARLSPNDESFTSVDLIHELLGNKVGAYGHCLYEIFGDADLLVRVWLDVSRYEAMAKQLASMPMVSAIVPFLCDREDYLWARKTERWLDISEQDIAENCQSIVECSRKLAKGKDMHDENLWRSLWEKGFIIKSLPEESCPSQENEDVRRIKFFSFLTLDRKVLSSPNRISSFVEKFCQNNHQPLRISDVSVYLGTSQLGNCLLKGTTDNYYDIYNLVVRDFSELNMDTPPHTYLAASRHWHESDDLAPETATGDQHAKTIFAFAGIPFDVIAGLSRSDDRYKALAEAYEAISPLLAVDEERLLTPFVLGLLDADDKAIRMGSSFLFEIEMHLAQYFTERLTRSYPGRNIQKLMASEIDKVKEEGRKGELEGKRMYVPASDLGQFTLRDYQFFLTRLCADQDVSADVGHAWKTQIESTINVRNDIAHGRFRNLAANWASHMKRIAPAMLLYYGLRRWNGTRNAKQTGDQS